LVHVELELRLKAGETARAEDYLKRFPELANDPEVARQLIATESRFRPMDANALLGAARHPAETGWLGGYRVEGRLGGGGMGVVFLARDVQLNRPVGLKVMRADLAANPLARQRFLREARAMAAVKHPHIVTIYQVGEDRGAPFMAMELLEGEVLDVRLRRVGRLPVAEVLPLGRQIAEGLAAAHERGLIHRDIKPANIWLEYRGQGSAVSGQRSQVNEVAGRPLTAGPQVEVPDYSVKILDFGLARAAGDNAHLTSTGAIVGTPAYMAPEQAQGRLLDARCDLFSLGCVLYKACAGQTPFGGSDAIATLVAVTIGQPTPLRRLNPGVPASLADLVMQMLAKEPADRPDSAREVADRLQAIARQRAARSATETRAAASESSGTQQLFCPAPRGQSERGLGWRRAAFLGAGVLLLLLPLVFFFRDALFPSATNEENKPPGKPPSRRPAQPKERGRRFAKDLDRRAAKWALSLGGEVQIVVDNDVPKVVSDIADLPARAFVLYAVNLWNKRVTDATLLHLKDLSQLRGLQLKRAQISDAGLEQLKGLTTLRELNLSGTSVGDSGLEHLKGLTNLRTLDLTATLVTTKGLVALQTALPRCQIICAFGTKPVAATIDRRAGSWVLSLGGRAGIRDKNGFRFVQAPAVLPAEPLTLEFVDLNFRVNDAGLAHLKGLRGLNALMVRGPQVTDAGLKHLAGHSNLGRLVLSNARVTDDGLQHLESLIKLYTLDLQDTEIRGPGLNYLRNLPNLQVLELSGSRLNDAGLKYVTHLVHLTSLSLKRTMHLTNAGLDQLKGLASLKKLRLDASPWLTDAGLAHLKDQRQLTELGLQHTAISDAGLVHLKCLADLQTLDVGNTKVSAKGVADLQKALRKCRIITSFGAK
jgi:serine/threonine protein kinase